MLGFASPICILIAAGAVRLGGTKPIKNPVRNYELVVIFGVDRVPELETSHIDFVTERVSASGAEIDSVNSWGRRKFAYPIQKQREGHYLLVRFSMDPEKVEDLERSLRLVEDVTRFLVVIEDPDVAAFEAKKLVEAER